MKASVIIEYSRSPKGYCYKTYLGGQKVRISLKEFNDFKKNIKINEQKGGGFWDMFRPKNLWEIWRRRNERRKEEKENIKELKRLIKDFDFHGPDYIINSDIKIKREKTLILNVLKKKGFKYNINDDVKKSKREFNNKFRKTLLYFIKRGILDGGNIKYFINAIINIKQLREIKKTTLTARPKDTWITNRLNNPPLDAKKNFISSKINQYHSLFNKINIKNTSSPINPQIREYENEILRIFKNKGYIGNNLNNTRYIKDLDDIITDLNTNETEQLFELFKNIDNLEENYHNIKRQIRNIIDDESNNRFNFNEKINDYSNDIKPHKNNIRNLLRKYNLTRTNNQNFKERINQIIESLKYDEVESLLSSLINIIELRKRERNTILSKIAQKNRQIQNLKNNKNELTNSFEVNKWLYDERRKEREAIERELKKLKRK